MFKEISEQARSVLVAEGRSYIARYSVLTAFSYSVFYLLIFFFTSFYKDYPQLSIAYGVIMFCFSSARVLLGRIVIRQGINNKNIWPYFVFISLALGFYWPSLYFFSLLYYQIEWPSVVLIILHAGITVACLENLKCDLKMCLVYVYTLLLPVLVLSLIMLPLNVGVTIALLMGLSLFYVTTMARRNYYDYWKRVVQNVQLDDERERFHELFNNSQVALIEIDYSSFNVISVNKKFLYLLDYKSADVEEFISSFNFSDLFVDKNDFNNIIDNLEAGKRIENSEIKILNKHNKEIIVTFFASFNMVRKTIEIAVVDLTGQKQVEKEKETMQKQMFQATKLASIGELAAGVAHEINNPLMIMFGNIEIVKEYLEEKGVKNNLISSVLEKQTESVFRVARIIEGLRTYARGGVEKEDEVDVNQAIKDSVVLIQSIYRSAEIVINSNFNTNNSFIYATKGKFQQVVMNILSNSRDAFDSVVEKKIDINTYNIDNTVVVEIVDSGVGIPKSELDKVFDSFYTTKDIGKGTGLGLSVSYAIIQSLNGEMSIQSSEGEGTKVRISLPTVKGTL